jgi:2-polyprenyl-3-methyl-5-hydroxy-6-metoxy-1,4-benzoquinol methylase
MKVEEIRQDSYVDEYFRLHVQDVEHILKYRDEFVDVACPVDGKTNTVWRFDKSGFRFVECTSCGTLFISPRPPAPRLAEFYSSARSFALFNSKIFPNSEDSRREFIFAPRARSVVDLCQQHLVSAPETLLDIGAGFGTFCEEIQKLQFFKTVIAVEPSKDLAETCRNKGLNVIEEMVEDLKVEAADVVVSFELIEHLFSPESFLRACAQVLAEQGLLILTTPNIHGFDLKVLGPLSENVDGPEHLNYFHSQSLGLLLEKCGFEVIESLTPGKLDAELVRKKVLAGEFDLSSQGFLEEVLINKWHQVGAAFQEFLAEQELSSHMWLVARKRTINDEFRK